jgi:hypothetical protein
MPLRMYADTVYTYTGNNFDNFDYANTSYSTSDFISLSFDVEAPLAANLSTVMLTPTSYTVSDGVETLNQMTVSESIFIFSTDASGNINDWNLVFEILDEDRAILTYWHPGLIDGGDASLNGFGDGAWNVNSPGTWTSSTTPPSTVPEPSTLLLLGSGLLATRGMIRRYFATRRTSADI